MKRFLKEVRQPEILNSGELADSLMLEKSKDALSKKVLPLFKGSEHKVLIVTKLDWVDNLLHLDKDLRKNLIAPFSINSAPLAKRWEVGAPEPARRIEAAGKLHDAGFKVRLRVDPIVPYPEEWFASYKDLTDSVFKRFTPERVTLGSLGLRSTINNSKDRSWTEYLTSLDGGSGYPSPSALAYFSR